jgi:hypothetical protein
MEEVVCDGALGGARHRGEPARRKSPTVDGGRLPGQRGAPRRWDTRGGAGGDGPGQRPLVTDVGFGDFGATSGWLHKGGRRGERRLLTGKRQWRCADSGSRARGSASGRGVGPVLDRRRAVGSRTRGVQVEGGR